MIAQKNNRFSSEKVPGPVKTGYCSLTYDSYRIAQFSLFDIYELVIVSSPHLTHFAVVMDGPQMATSEKF